MSQRKKVVAVLFGGRSVEHDVSVVTGQQIMQALDATRYDVIPIYISRDGQWFTGDPLRDIASFRDDNLTRRKDVRAVLLSPDVRHHGLIVDPVPSGLFAKPTVLRVDVLFPAVHGTHGEDGTLQGLFELADIPYVGFATLGSALTNDKIMTKQVLRQAGIAVVDDLSLTRAEWRRDRDSVVQRISEKFALPLFVKPATLGSSIGISCVNDPALLAPALEMAFNLDRRVLIEAAVPNVVEVNCSVIGDGNNNRASVLEQPITYTDFLTYEDKYLAGSKGMKSADRMIPAPLDDDKTRRIQEIAVRAFEAVDGRGIVRIDFLLNGATDEVFVNELNTLPGSFSFYLWKPSGLSESALLDQVIVYALEAHAEKRRTVTNYRSSLLEVAASRGLKGSKSGKR